MRIRFIGTAGPDGWPAPACACASCATPPPGHRHPTAVLIDDTVRLPPAAGDAATGSGGGAGGTTAEREGETARLPPGYRLATTADGIALTTPDGSRLLYIPPPTAGGPSFQATTDAASASPPDAESSAAESSGAEQRGGSYEVVLLDLLGSPERLGVLRRRGVVDERTHVVAVGIDHRVRSAAELARRMALWGARAVPDGAAIDSAEAPVSREQARRTLLLGGSRSGKSAEAELRLAAEPYVTYVATGPKGRGDGEWAARVDAHRRRRPAHWATVETTALAETIELARTPMLVDGLGTWVAAMFDECDAWEDPANREAVARRCEDLVAAWRRTPQRVVAVSDEVGLGVIPATSGIRAYRDTLGSLNQRLAAESEDVTLVVAGRLLPLP